MSAEADALVALNQACRGDDEAGVDLAHALAALRQLARAVAVAVVRHGPGGPVVHLADGVPLASPDLPPSELEQPPSTGLTTLPVPAAWAEQGIVAVRAWTLSEPGRSVQLAWDLEPGEPDALLLAGLHVLHSALGRELAEERLRDLGARMNSAQKLANMGDYDWHISTDTNRWSDQLYRIYGHEPQSFNASYEKFLSMLHPDDRAEVTSVHQAAYATGEGYQTLERIVRPDGELRYLSTNGEVILDESGAPMRMRGTCVDITERVLAEQAREREGERFRRLVDAAPDAVVLVDAHDTIIEANPRARELLGEEPTGRSIAEVLPPSVRAGGTGVEARGLDGRALHLDVIAETVEDRVDEGHQQQLTAVFLHDAEPRLRNEALAARLGEAQLRRRQALEINDNVVQGLTAMAYALDQDQFTVASGFLSRTLHAARHMMDDLLEPLDGQGLQPGDLVRSTPTDLGQRPEELVVVSAADGESAEATSDAAADLGADQALDLPTLDSSASAGGTGGGGGPQGGSPRHLRPVPGSTGEGPDAVDGSTDDSTPLAGVRRVLVVDDSTDLRVLMRTWLDTRPGFSVVGEAADGREAVDRATELQPDLVMLDLAMPHMDGLEALPLIKEAVAGVRVVVLSGFNESSLARKARSVGADEYAVKGGSMRELVNLLETLVPS